MAADDIIIDDDDWEEDDEESTITPTDYETIITRSSATASPCPSYAKSYVQIVSGYISFGNGSSIGSLTQQFSIMPATSGIYKGLSCNARKIDVRGEEILFKVGSYIPVTGILQVITNIKLQVGQEINWTIEKLPFKNGLCVASR